LGWLPRSPLRQAARPPQVAALLEKIRADQAAALEGTQAQAVQERSRRDRRRAAARCSAASRAGLGAAAADPSGSAGRRRP
jgi:hypothetical protein